MLEASKGDLAWTTVGCTYELGKTQAKRQRRRLGSVTAGREVGSGGGTGSVPKEEEEQEEENGIGEAKEKTLKTT